MNTKTYHFVTFTLVLAGALNWGLVGLFGLDLVDLLFSSVPALKMLVYVAVGLSGVYILATHKADCKICGGKK